VRFVTGRTRDFLPGGPPRARLRHGEVSAGHNVIIPGKPGAMGHPSSSLRPARWLVLFIATSVIWGSSFLFIRVAVEHMPPSAVVFGRTILGAAFLVPLAVRCRAFRGIRRVIVPVIVVTVLDLAAPTFLTAWGEQHVSSSMAGILTATDPLFTAILALWLIRSEVPDRKRLAGLVVGFGGVIALLGIDVRGSATELLAAGAVLLSALGYAVAALLYRRWLADEPALAVTALMTAISSVAFLAPAAVDLPGRLPPVSSLLALAALGIVNTGLAYWLFYLLIDEAGAATASVITYVMPVVALFLGVGLLGERLTIGAVAGLLLIAVGAWLATRGPAPVRQDATGGSDGQARHARRGSGSSAGCGPTPAGLSAAYGLAPADVGRSQPILGHLGRRYAPPQVLGLARTLHAQGEVGLALTVDLRVEHLVVEVGSDLRLEVDVRPGGLDDLVVLAGSGRG
jgi:drug/metabolite transporter (DMT)-like permease